VTGSNSKRYEHCYLFFSRDLSYAVLISYVHVKRRFKKEIIEGLEICVIALLTEPSDSNQGHNKSKILERLYVKKEEQIQYIKATFSSQGTLCIFINLPKDIDYLDHFVIKPYVNSSQRSACIVQTQKSVNKNVYCYNCQLNNFSDILSYDTSGNVCIKSLSANQESVILNACNLFFVVKGTAELAIFNNRENTTISMANIIKPFPSEIEGDHLLKSSDIGLTSVRILNAFVKDINYILAVDVFAKKIVHKLDVHYFAATRTYLHANQVCWSGKFVYLTYWNPSNRYILKCFRLDSTFSLVSLAKAAVHKSFSLEQLELMELPNMLRNMLK